MKKKIEEVQQYFKAKLLDGDFEITEITEHVAKVTIDKEYRFSIWIGNFNHIPESTRLYDGWYNFMMLDLTMEEAILLNSILKPFVTDYRKNTLIEQKRKELEQLEKELSESK